MKGEEPRHPAVGALFMGGFPLHPTPTWYTNGVSSSPLKCRHEEAHRNVWLVLKAHGWEPAQELDMDIAQTLTVLAKMGVTDTRELLRLTLEHFELAPLH